MATDPEIARMFNAVISVQPITGISGGDEVLGTVVTNIPAYIEDLQEVVPDATGMDQNAKHLILTAYPVTYQHRVWISADSSVPENSKRPFSVKRFNDPLSYPATVSHYEVKLG